MFKKVKENKKGFTLAELLIVVAIIAVLVAISIPIFTSQLEKAREATDIANIRAAYADACVDSLTTKDGGATTAVSEKMVSTGKMDKIENTVVGGFDCKDLELVKGKTCTITIDATGNVTIAVTNP